MRVQRNAQIETKVAAFSVLADLTYMQPKSTLRSSGYNVRCLEVIRTLKLGLSVASLKPGRITETSMS